MDSLISAGARALATGDPLGALKRVALRDDAPALALRGIAMAQLGDLGRAKTLLRSAARALRPEGAGAARGLGAREAPVARRGARLRSERGGGAREMCRRRGRDRAGLARPRL